jgi:hypothetical protein
VPPPKATSFADDLASISAPAATPPTTFAQDLARVTGGPPVPPAPSAVTRFGEGFLRTNPISATLSLGKALLTEPAKQVADEMIFQPFDQRATQALEAYHQGRPLAALGYGAAAIPFVGTAVGSIVDRARSGDVAGAAGEAVGMGSAFEPARAAVGDAVGAAGRAGVDAVRAVPGGPPLLNRMADTLETNASRRLGETMAPPGTSRSALRMRNTATTLGPDLLRTDMTGWTATGFRRQLSARLLEAQQELDTAADERLNARSYDTAPILSALEARRQGQTAQTLVANQPTATRTTRTSSIVDAQGQSITVDNPPQAVPLGHDVTPSPNAPRSAMIDRAIQEVRQLGPLASYESLRRIRQAYDIPARVKYNPSMVGDYLQAQGQADGAADVTSVLRDHLAQFDPATAQANAHYHVFRNAHEVMAAADEIQRGAPNASTRMVSRLGGMLAGGEVAGLRGALLGAVVAPSFDAALSGGPTAQIKIARGLAQLADALRGGKPDAVWSSVNSLRRLTPMRTSLKLALPSAQLTGGGAPPIPVTADDQSGPPVPPK